MYSVQTSTSIFTGANNPQNIHSLAAITNALSNPGLGLQLRRRRHLSQLSYYILNYPKSSLTSIPSEPDPGGHLRRSLTSI